MPQIMLRKPRVEIRAGLPVRELYTRVLQALCDWNEAQADAFRGAAAYAIDRTQLMQLARQYVDLVELPSA